MTFWPVTLAECEVKHSRHSGMFQVDSKCPEVASELVRDIFEFFDLFLFLFIILAGNIDCKSILQKTLKQLALVTSKYEQNRDTSQSNFQCVSLRRQYVRYVEP